MKVRKVMNMMKRGKSVELYREGYEGDENGFMSNENEAGTGCQWIGNGRGAFYSLDGAGMIGSAEEFYRMHDVKGSTKKGFCFKFNALPKDMTFSGFEGEEAESLSVTLGMLGDVYRCFRWSGGVLFVREEYLEPFEYPKLLVRMSRDRRLPYLAVLENDQQVGAVLPMLFVIESEEGHQIYDELEEVRQEIWQEVTRGSRV